MCGKPAGRLLVGMGDPNELERSGEFRARPHAADDGRPPRPKARIAAFAVFAVLLLVLAAVVAGLLKSAEREVREAETQIAALEAEGAFEAAERRLAEAERSAAYLFPRYRERLRALSERIRAASAKRALAEVNAKAALWAALEAFASGAVGAPEAARMLEEIARSDAFGRTRAGIEAAARAAEMRAALPAAPTSTAAPGPAGAVDPTGRAR